MYDIEVSVAMITYNHGRFVSELGRSSLAKTPGGYEQ